MINCIPCRSTRKLKNPRQSSSFHSGTVKPKLHYKPGKIIFEDRNRKVFSALCTSRTASGTGVIVKQFKISEPINRRKIELCETLVRMIENIAGLEHEHLVRYLEASYNLETQFFEVITEQLPITFDENYINDEYHTKMYMLDVLETVRFLEEHGYTYLNLKPSNVLFDHSGTIKLRDFIGNHIIETLISGNEDTCDRNEGKTDTEVDIKSFMDFVRYIGMYKIKFSNTSSYNRFIFYLENLRRWNFSRLAADKFFQEIKISDSPINSSFKGFTRKVTLLKTSNDNPLFLTSEKHKNEYKGDANQRLNKDRMFVGNDDDRESEMFLKNLQRLQAFQKTKVVGSKPSHSSIHKSGVSIENQDTGNYKACNIQKLKDIQKQLEEDFGINSDSEDPVTTERDCVPKEQYNQPSLKRYVNTPRPEKKSSNLDELRQKIRLLEQNFDDWGEPSDESSDHIVIKDAQESDRQTDNNDIVNGRCENFAPKAFPNERRMPEINKAFTFDSNTLKQSNTQKLPVKELERAKINRCATTDELEIVSNPSNVFLNRIETSNFNNSISNEDLKEKSKSDLFEKESFKKEENPFVSSKTLTNGWNNVKLCSSRVPTEETRGTKNNGRDEQDNNGRFHQTRCKLNLSTFSQHIDDSEDLEWGKAESKYDITKDLMRRRRRDSQLRQSLNF